MSQHAATVEWTRNGAVFTDGKYSRGHVWRFDGGVEVPASSDPGTVRPPLSVVEAVDPEEALIASLSSCHMLWFLAIAAKRGFVVDSYKDEATAEMGRDPDGGLSMHRVTLRPQVRFGGERRPSSEEFAAMHDEAHHKCYIARSVKAEVVCEPVVE